MPIFRKKREPAKAVPPPIPSRTLTQEQVNNALDYEVARSTRYMRPLSILRIVPQVSGSDYVGPADMRTVSEAAGVLLRDVDHLGPFDDHSLLAVLPETTADAARTVAHRLGSSDMPLSLTTQRPRADCWSLRLRVRLGEAKASILDLRSPSPLQSVYPYGHRTPIKDEARAMARDLPKLRSSSHSHASFDQ